MFAIRSALLTLPAVVAALAAGAPAAGAASFDSALGPCTSESGPAGQGGPGGTTNQICMGGGVATIGPSIGQIATVTGGSGASIVAAGNVAVG
jgi:hypothetical protein